ncbi:MAG: HAD-IIA family hydrolase [Campylobacter sp.]|nr:HAD-IIA family hydrolase [Campylobacter sp.]MDY4803108.1 HAD-IIA family hydrolase [Campylobacter sp.]
MIYFVDVQGTLISDSDKSPIYGSKNLIRYFNTHNIPYMVITNNTKAKSSDFLANLKSKGLDIRPDAYIDPFCVLDDVCKPCSAALFGAPQFIKTMDELGYTQDFSSPKAVIIASYDAFSFDDFAKMIELVQKGAKLIAMHATSTYKKNGKLYPGVGAIASMIEYATGIKAAVVGKPSELFYRTALIKASKQLSSKEILYQNLHEGMAQSSEFMDFSSVSIISDDAKGDLLGAKELGMQTILVLSGKVDKLENAGVRSSAINYTFGNVGRFLESIEDE